MKFETAIGVSGTFELVVRRRDGSVRTRMGPFANLITNGGFNQYVSLDYPTTEGCAIGTGTATPLVTDTQLGNRVATVNNPVANVSGLKWESPGRWVNYGIVHQFAVDAYIGTITEVGMQLWGIQSPPKPLFSKALLPAPLELITGDQLEVTYKLYHNLQEDDITKVVTIDGIDYTVTCRAMVLNANSLDSSYSFEQVKNGYGWKGWNASINYAYALETDVLYPATAIWTTAHQPTAGESETRTYAAYVSNSFEVFPKFLWKIGKGNYPTGVGLIMIRSTNASGTYQFKFSPKLPKDATKMLTFIMKAKFYRGVPPV